MPVPCGHVPILTDGRSRPHALLPENHHRHIPVGNVQRALAAWRSLNATVLGRYDESYASG